MTTPTFEPVELPSRYAKAFVAIVTAVLALLVTALTDNTVTLVETLGISVAGVTAIGVHLVPNLPSGVGHYAKAIVAVIGIGLQAAVPLVVDGNFPTSAWLLVLLAALGALSVGITPNAAASGVRVSSAGIISTSDPAEVRAALERMRARERVRRGLEDTPESSL